jgi:hypothetical protein
MSATEILRQIKALPESEQAAFAELFHQWEAQGNGGSGRPLSRPACPDFSARRSRIFGGAVLPNMILIARDRERW